MNMHRFLIASVVGAVLLSARLASAQEFIAGVQLQLVTARTLTVGDRSDGTPSSGALAADVEVDVSPYFSFGFAPRLILEAVPRREGDKRGAQIDLMGRITGRVPVTRKLTPFAYGSAGFSTFSVPEAPEPVKQSDGIALGFGGGAAYRLSDEVAVVLDVGYQFGFQRRTGTLDGQSVAEDYRLSDLHLGVGIQTNL